MTWKNFVSRLAIRSPRRGVATAVLYGLSLAVRFTSATGEEVEIPPQAAQRAHSLISIMTRLHAPAADRLPSGLAAEFVAARLHRALSSVDFALPLRVVADRNKPCRDPEAAVAARLTPEKTQPEENMTCA